MRASFFAILAVLGPIAGLVGVPQAATAQDGPSVQVRGGEHSGFGRLVFDWAARVGYEARIEGERLRVTFDRPARFDLSPLSRDLEDYIGRAEVAADGRGVTVPLKQDFGLKHFRLGAKVVVDLRDDGVSTPPGTASTTGTTSGGASSRRRNAATGATAGNAGRPIPLVPAAPAEPPAPLTGAAPQVQVRVGEHPGFGRLVFDWPGPVPYRAEQAPGRIVIRFGRPARFDLSRFRKAPPAPVRGLTVKPLPDGVAVELAVPEGTALRHYADKGQVVIDVVGGAAPGPAPGDESTAASKAASATSSATAPGAPTSLLPPKDQPAETRAATAPAASEKAEPSKPKKTAAAKHESSKKPRVKSATDAKSEDPPKDDPLADCLAEKAKEDAKKAKEDAEKAKEDAQKAEEDARKAEEEAKKETPGTLVSANHRAPLPPSRSVPGRAVNRDGGITLRFNWADPVAAAAFWRGDRLWLVFDRRAQANIARRIAKVAPELGEVTQTAENGATVIRMAPDRRLSVGLRPDGNDWLVNLASETDAPSTEVALRPDRSQGQARILVPLPSGGRLLELKDPIMGDRIHVVPVAAPGLGLERPRRYPQFRVLGAFQGLVVHAVSDAVSIERTETGVVVAAPGGLYISNAKRIGGNSRKLASSRSGARLFDLKAWRRGDANRFTYNKQKLQEGLVGTQGRALDSGRLELARFYYAHGMANEALGLLELIERSGGPLADDPQVLLMQASGQFIKRDYLQAIESLRHPAFDGETEAFAWRAAAAAVDQNWTDAVELFMAADTLIDDYPRAIRMNLRLLAAEARLGVSDTGGASQYLNQVLAEEPTAVETGPIDFLEGRRLLLDDEVEAGLELWRKAARSDNLAAAARARLAMVEWKLEEQEITLAEASEELERIRFLWRGDDFEYALLLRLGDLYAEQERYRDSLLSLRQAVSYLPNPARAEAVASRMRSLFEDLYMGEIAERLPPLRALAIYEEFKELTPAGSKGDALISHLADRLVEIDLLDQAAGLLGQQARYRLEGLEKVGMGARVATLRLLNDQPLDALEILEDSEVGELPEGLAKERRLLKASALSQAGITDRALDTLAGDQSYEARRLRAEILWDMERWADAAAVLESLLPRAIDYSEPLDEDNAHLVISLAVAFTLNGDRGGLHRLDWDYRDAMEGTPQAQTFNMLTSDLDTSGITSIRDELAGVEAIQAFMAGYRERLEENALGTVN